MKIFITIPRPNTDDIVVGIGEDAQISVEPTDTVDVLYDKVSAESGYDTKSFILCHSSKGHMKPGDFLNKYKFRANDIISMNLKLWVFILW